MTVTAGPQAAPASPELVVSSLTVRFGALTALDDVSLTVRAGECVAIAGENGAGKTTLIRAVGGDVVPVSGTIELGGRPLAPDPIATARLGVRIVWQDLALANNLDIASNIMLGNERRRHLFSSVSLHNEATRVLAQFGIPIQDTTRSVESLSGGQRQMVAVARAMAHTPRILLLDEPTASLGVRESDLVERLITRLREQGTTILLSCHDIAQMFRLADRIVVLRHGRLVAEVSPSEVHPDDVTALVSGQKVDSSARRQLTRLHGLAGRLVSSDPSSSLSLILSALGAAIGSERLCMHLLSDDGMLQCAASLGVPRVLLDAWERLPADSGGGPAGTAAHTQRPVVEDNIPARPGSWSGFGTLARSAKVASSWSVPVLGPGGLLGVITVFRSTTGKPQRDDLDLAGLYAGYAASAVERDRLLDQVTARNRVLETIREVLQSLAGPMPVADGLDSALHALRGGLGASQVALVTRTPDGDAGDGTAAEGAASDGTAGDGTVDGGNVEAGTHCRAYAGPHADPPAATLALARSALDEGPRGSAFFIPNDSGDCLGVTFTAPDGPTVLLATWPAGMARDDRTDLLEDAAHSLRLALEREKTLAARQEAMALRQSRDMQHAFLRRLSHELRTPLTAITGYASSLLQQDVTWDADTQQRFLSRIAAESSRLGRLVNDLLDFSAIESGIFRLECDWCDLPLVLDAAVAVLPPERAPLVEVKAAPGLPAIWADHDRLEQVFVNLLGNALTHNPPGTRVQVTAEAASAAIVTASAAATGTVTVKVADDGDGMSPELMRETADAGRPVTGQARKRGAGAGLGLSIAKGIVAAHGGSMELEPTKRGTCFRVSLPVEMPPGAMRERSTGD
ncbi:MAG TPA: ATP-binding cassette domain-containing protein [Trebonia sp.]|jgi:signal transduction histidine kinase/ABC-type multidrug transport system ATPase subunit|nr:ATP-binding cassette domain-containing protein [Trebonia sp.]